MNNHDRDILLENQALKSEFKTRKLDLTQVFHPMPDNLLWENRALRHLLAWVQKYAECGDRATMEAEEDRQFTEFLHAQDDDIF